MRFNLIKTFSSAGFSLIEVLISTTLMSILGMGVVSISNVANQNSQQLKAVRVVISARAQIEAEFKNPAAWRETVARNSSFDCMTKAPGCSLSDSADGAYDFILYDSAGIQKITFDPADPKTRLQMQGGACPAGTPNPSPICPLKFQARWKPACQSYPCLQPTVEIRVVLASDYPDLGKVKLNFTNYGYSTVRGINEDTIQSACLILNGTYNSFNRTCRPKHAGRSCASLGLPYQVVKGVQDDGNIDCQPLYRSQCSATQVMTGVDSSGQAICASKVGVCPVVACQGSWSACSAACDGGSRTFTVTTPASYGGAACAAADGATQACNTQACVVPVNCVGSWGSCSQSCGGGTRTYSVSTPAANGGAACSVANGATQSCNSQACAVNCSGSWGACNRSCGGGTRTYNISIPASNGGANCSYNSGATQSCNTQACPVNCSGSWSACSQPCGGGTRTYSITTLASNGGLSCSYSDGDTSSCNPQACTPAPVNCSGSWGACNLGTGKQDYLVTQSPKNGGAACPNSPRNCAVNCVGSWGACSNGVKTYTITQSALNGGSSCPYADGANSITGCVAPTTTTTSTTTTTTLPALTCKWKSTQSICTATRGLGVCDLGAVACNPGNAGVYVTHCPDSGGGGACGNDFTQCKTKAGPASPFNGTFCGVFRCDCK